MKTGIQKFWLSVPHPYFLKNKSKIGLYFSVTRILSINDDVQFIPSLLKDIDHNTLSEDVCLYIFSHGSLDFLRLLGAFLWIENVGTSKSYLSVNENSPKSLHEWVMLFSIQPLTGHDQDEKPLGKLELDWKTWNLPIFLA